MRDAAIIAALVCLAVASTGTALAQARSEIPVREVLLSDGERRYSVPIKVGNTALRQDWTAARRACGSFLACWRTAMPRAVASVTDIAMTLALNSTGKSAPAH